MLIAIVNHSTRCSNADVQTMTRAVAHQVRYHAAPAWEKHVPSVIFYADPTQIPAGAQKVVVFDNADQQGALGYHDVGPDGLPYAKVFAATTLDNGGQILQGTLTVASVLSHEVLEMYVDPSCNGWADDGNGNLYALEVGDPVENDSYDVSVSTPAGTVLVAVSNFVLPAWFTATTAPETRVDWLHIAHGPFQMTSRGYVIKSTEGKVTQVFGDDYPEWKKPVKQNPAARTARRQNQT